MADSEQDLFHEFIIIKVIYKPILSCGNESWALTSQVSSQEKIYLRAVEGKIRRDTTRNRTTRKPLLEMVNKSQLRWFDHVQRMDGGRFSKEEELLGQKV